MRRVVAAAVGAVLAVGALSACGSGSGSVDLDADGGIKVEASDGTLELGTFELPPEWPSEVPTPPGFEVFMAGSTPEDITGGFNAWFQAPGDQMATVDTYVKDLMNRGFAPDGDIPLGANGMYGLVGNGYKVGMLAVNTGDVTTLTMRVEPTG